MKFNFFLLYYLHYQSDLSLSDYLLKLFPKCIHLNLPFKTKMNATVVRYFDILGRLFEYSENQKPTL